MASTNGQPANRISFRPRAASQVERLRDTAFARRVAKSYALDLQTVLARLTADPLGWGESRSGTGEPEVVRRRGQSIFLSVYYSYYPKLRKVVVQRVRMNPDGPLAG